MKARLLPLTALGVAGLAALTTFVTFAWFGIGFVPLALLALVAFLVVALPLLGVAARRSFDNPILARRSTWRWLAGGTLAYVVFAQLMVGNRPAPEVTPPEPAPGTQYWSLSNGSRLAYVKTEARRTRGAVPVIVLHDGPGVPALARLQRLPERPYDFLADEGYDVYYYDQIGAGLSGRIHLGEDPPYTVARHVQDLEEIRRHLGAPRLFLIGEGWGATLASQYLVGHGDRVEKVVMESPAPVWFPAWPSYADPAARARMTDVQASALALLARPTPRLMIGRMVSDFNSRVAHEMVEDWEADQWWTRLQEESLRLGQPKLSCASETPGVLQPPTGLGFFAYSYTMRDALRIEDPRPALSSVDVPALIIRGSCDHIDWQVSYEYLRTLPKARYVAIPAAGHLVWLDQPSLHGEVLRAFVRGEKLPLEFYEPGRVPSTPSGSAP